MSEALRDGPFTFDDPTGGFFVWLRLPEGVESPDVVVNARANGVLVSDGGAFFVGQPDAGYLRLSFSMLGNDLLVDGARRLQQSLMSAV